jgi:hypothetical protein
MRDLSDSARSVLHRYRAAESLRAGEKERLLDLVQQRGARGDLPRFQVDVPPPTVPISGTWLLQAPLGKALIGAGLAVGLTIPVALRRHAPSLGPAPAAVSLLPVLTPLRIDPDVPEPPLSSTSAGARKETDVAPDEPVGPSKTHARSIPRPAARAEKKESAPLSAPPPPPPQPQEATIDEEVRLLTAAQASLRGGQPRRALSFIDEHATRFPRGKLTDAREVARMTALCDLGQAGAARERAERFLSDHPSSPFSDRVRRLCLPKE